MKNLAKKIHAQVNAVWRLPFYVRGLRQLHQDVYALKQHLYHAQDNVPRDALNGQFSKHQIFAELARTFPFDVFIETGTWLGGTTRFLAQHGKPVYTVEIYEPSYRRAQQHLQSLPNVKAFLGGSTATLEKHILPAVAEDALTFVYLDAHWRAHLPLREEMALVFAALPRAIIMIDDMCVPGDDGYGFDDYGPGQQLDLDYLRLVLTQFNAASFARRMASVQDHLPNDLLPPRGTTVHAADTAIINQLRGFASLRAVD